MNGFDDDEEDEDILNIQLSLPFVVTGLLMLILGLILPIFFLQDKWLKTFCFAMFFLSFFVMTKRQKSDSDYD